MKRTMSTISIRGAWVAALLLGSLQACTKLDEVPKSNLTPGTFYNNQAEALAGLSGVYAQLRGAFPGYCCAYYVLSEISTDEMVVPTRGQDWYDNGRWLEMHRQTWTATSPSGLQDINSAWVNDFTGIANANAVLSALQSRTVMDSVKQAGIIAELRALRAFYYYQLNDLFGGVPVVTTTEVVPRLRASRDSVFKFVESELLAARKDLPLTRSAGDNGRFTKGAVDAILASLYINAGVFTKDGGGFSATGYNSCNGIAVTGFASACDAAVARVDSILLSNVYQLADTFVKNFRADNNLSPENIFVVKFINQDGLGFPILQTTLHYNQFTPTPWNGFATLAQTFAQFDTVNDRRSKIFLVGPQFNLETGDTVCIRPGCDKGAPRLVFTPSIADVTQATEGEGVRIYKWPYDPKHVQQNNGNDFAYFRLAEMYLIKAEAELAGATATAPGGATPLALVRAVRARSFPGGDTLSAVNLNGVLHERLLELAFEAKRRTDLIRYGQYTLAWQFKAAGDAHLTLMPVPQSQRSANPKLDQNPGY
jgi:starch-binding outer membrane protein, SusD/RagB family